MKTPLTYGALIAVIGALATFGLFFAGYHDTPEKLQVGQTIGSVVGIVTAVAGLALAMRERRAEYPADKTWGYGPAFGVGFLTMLVAALLGAITLYVYIAIVNPQFSEMIYQTQVVKMQAKGASAAQIDAASGVMRKFLSPVVMTCFQILWGIIGGAVLSLIVAIFFRRPLAPSANLESAVPPPVA